MYMYSFNYSAPIEFLLQRANYHYVRPENYVRNTVDGRWHGKIITKYIAHIHFDLQIDGKHSVFRLPRKESNEDRRIRRKIKKFKTRIPTLKEIKTMKHLSNLIK